MGKVLMLRLFLIIITMVWVGGASQTFCRDAQSLLSVGDPAPPIDIAHWVKGMERNSRGDFQPLTNFGDGNIYVIEFWATWCKPCVAGMPHLSNLQQEFAEENVTVIGISDEPLQRVENFLLKDMARTDYIIATDPDRSVYSDYLVGSGDTGIPRAFVIGKEGLVEWIGHPNDLDEPLGAVVDGTWDREKSTVKHKKKMAPFVLKKVALIQMEKAISSDDGDEYLLGSQLADQWWEDANLLNTMAWMIADDPAVETRSLELAQRMAARANDLTESSNSQILNTLSRVCHDRGNLTEAVKWQRLAVENSDDQTYKKTLSRYEKEKEETKNGGDPGPTINR